jgi:hypothetical protein
MRSASDLHFEDAVGIRSPLAFLNLSNWIKPFSSWCGTTVSGFGPPCTAGSKGGMFMGRCAAVVLTLLVVTTSLSAQEMSIFPDKALEAAVRKSVFEKRNNDQPILAKDVEKISTIKAPKAGIKNLAGLEHCRELRELNLSNNEIEEIAPLAPLKYLQSLDLRTESSRLKLCVTSRCSSTSISMATR